MGGASGDDQAATERRSAAGAGRRREGLRHVCLSNSSRRATIKLQPGARRLRPVRQAVRRQEREPADPRLPTPGRRVPQAQERRGRPRPRGPDGSARRSPRCGTANGSGPRPRSPGSRPPTRHAWPLPAPRRRRRRQDRPAEDAPGRGKPPHEYQSCIDKDCQRPVCIAFKEGYRDGDRTATSGLRQGIPRRHRRMHATASIRRTTR